MNLRRILMGLTLSLLISSSYANPFNQYPTPAPRLQPSPGIVLQQGIEKLTKYLASRGDKNSPSLAAFVDNTIAPLFDFTYMAKSTAGPQARYMSPQQGAAMEQKLRRLFLAAMVNKLSGYRHARVKYLRPLGNPRSGEITLRLMAYQQGNPYPQRLSFKMYRGPQGWKVYDVSADGQSALAFFRSQFAFEARQHTRSNYGASRGAGRPGM